MKKKKMHFQLIQNRMVHQKMKTIQLLTMREHTYFQSIKSRTSTQHRNFNLPSSVLINFEYMIYDRITPEIYIYMQLPLIRSFYIDK